MNIHDVHVRPITHSRHFRACGPIKNIVWNGPRQLSDHWGMVLGSYQTIGAPISDRSVQVLPPTGVVLARVHPSSPPSASLHFLILRPSVVFGVIWVHCVVDRVTTGL